MNLSLETVMRCLDLVPLVRENPGIKLAELARRTGFSEKAIVDHLVPALMLCGAPPYMPHDYVSIWLEGDEVHCSFADHFQRPVTLLPIEVTALHVALSAAAVPGGRDRKAEERIRALREKIERALPEAQRIFLEEGRRVHVEDNLDRGSPILEQLEEAVEARRKVEIEYLSRGDTRLRRRVVRPHGVIVQNGVAYVPAYDEIRARVVTFRLDRINDLRPLEETFLPEADFDLAAYAERGLFGGDDRDDMTVVVKARGAGARRVAEMLDQRQWSWDVPGEELTLRLPTSRPVAVVRFVFSLGSGVEIVEPEDVRRLAAAEVAALRKRL